MQKMKRWSAAGMCALSLFTCAGPAFAAPAYKDISGHWAQKAITNAKIQGLVGGYPDGRYKPESQITRSEALSMIANLFPEKELNAVYEKSFPKWKAKLEKNNIPKWAYKSTVFAMEIPMVKEGYLEVIMSKGKAPKPEMAKRYEVIVCLVNALKWQGEAKKSTVLKYNDTDQILPEAIPFIDIAIRKGILNEKGDNQGNFRPNHTISRAEMAVILEKAYAYAPKNPAVKPASPKPAPLPKPAPVPATPTPALPPKPVPPAPVKPELPQSPVAPTPKPPAAEPVKPAPSRIEGTVTLARLQDGFLVLQVADASGRLHLKTGESSRVVLTQDGQSYRQDLKAGDQVQLSFEGENLLSVQILKNAPAPSQETGRNAYKGAYIKEISQTLGASSLTLTDAAGKDHKAAVTPSSAIRVRGRAGTLAELSVGYLVDAVILDGAVSELVTEEEYRKATLVGRVESIDLRKQTLVIKENAKGPVTLGFETMGPNPTVFEDIRRYSQMPPSRLRAGDEVIVIGVYRQGLLMAEKVSASLQTDF